MWVKIKDLHMTKISVTITCPCLNSGSSLIMYKRQIYCSLFMKQIYWSEFVLKIGIQADPCQLQGPWSITPFAQAHPIIDHNSNRSTTTALWTASHSSSKNLIDLRTNLCDLSPVGSFKRAQRGAYNTWISGTRIYWYRVEVLVANFMHICCESLYHVFASKLCSGLMLHRSLKSFYNPYLNILIHAAYMRQWIG